MLFSLSLQMLQLVDVQTDKVYDWVDKVKDMAIEYAPKLVGAILVYIIGRWVIKWISKLLTKMLEKRHFDSSLQYFLGSLVKFSLIVLLVISAIGILGVNITSFAALLAGAGLAIGSALNGSLGNFAGGVMILILKPYKVGDIIDAQDYFGIVEKIGIFYTTVLTSSNNTIHIPNGPLSTGTINNLSNQKNVRIDMHVPVADDTDIDLARKLAVEVMKAHPDVIDNPAPDLKVKILENEGMVMVLFPRIAIKTYDHKNPRQMEKDYYSVYYGVREGVKKAFQEHGIKRPATSLELEKYNFEENV